MVYNLRFNMSKKEIYDLVERGKLTANIPLDRLTEMCEAERDGRCVVLPCKVGDTVYIVENFAKTNTEILGISPKSGYCIKECTFLGIVCVDISTKEMEYIVCEKIAILVEKYKTIFLTKEAAEKALEGLELIN